MRAKITYDLNANNRRNPEKLKTVEFDVICPKKILEIDCNNDEFIITQIKPENDIERINLNEMESQMFGFKCLKCGKFFVRTVANKHVQTFLESIIN